MFKCIYTMEGVHNSLKLHTTNDYKDELLSSKLREEGNVFYKSKQLKEALEKYNKSIFCAPHPKLTCEKLSENEYTPLALGYGNRSAVLFQLKEYEICISDIDRSINLCISKITQLKLEERKIKCLLAIERLEEVQELLKNCQIQLNTLELEKKDKECYQKSFCKLIQQCDQGIQRGSSQNKKQKSRYEEIKCADGLTKLTSDDLIFAYNNPRPPSLDDKPNPTIPAFSCALKLQYSTDQGRYVVATRDIKPSNPTVSAFSHTCEVISVETAHTTFVNPEEPNSPLSFCSFCFARCAAPIPCPECTNVVFCNEECRSKGWDKFHMKECPVYPQLLQLGKVYVEAYRIIAGQSPDELKNFVSLFQKDEQRSPLDQILNEEQICDSGSYRGVYFLEGNIKTAITERLICFSAHAFIMTQLLIQSNRFFTDNTGHRNTPNEEDIIFIGSLLVRNINGMNCNHIKIVESHIKAKTNNYIEHDVILGEGLYIAESLFNHSCIPSAMLFFYGNVCVIRATRFISSKSQVYICYKNVYFYEPDRTIRRRYLSEGHLFVCKCDICVNDCRLSASDLKGDLAVFEFSRLRTKDRILRNNIESSESLQLELDNLVKRNIVMSMRLDSKSFDINNYLDLALETIEFFDRFVDIPNHLYIHLNIILQHIFARQGSSYFINPAKTNVSKHMSDLLNEFYLQFS